MNRNWIIAHASSIIDGCTIYHSNCERSVARQRLISQCNRDGPHPDMMRLVAWGKCKYLISRVDRDPWQLWVVIERDRMA